MRSSPKHGPGRTTAATECAERHTERLPAGHWEPKSPGRHYLPGPIEPPVGIEPTTYSLRVNRYAD